MLRIFFMFLIGVFLTGCTSSSPEAWLFKGGMKKMEVIEILDNEGYSYDESDNEISVNTSIDYLGQRWSSMSISFNDNEEVDKVSFYGSEEDSSINKYALIDALKKQLGESSGGFGVMTTWSNEDKWLVTFADNNPPFPKALTYWYNEYMPKDDSDNSQDDVPSDD